MNRDDYDYVSTFHNRFARVKHDGKWFHVALDWKPAYKQRYDWVGAFHCGLAGARENGKWFHIATDGKPAYSQRYDFVCDFSNGRALAWKAERVFYIDVNGRCAQGNSEQRGACLKNAIKIINGERNDQYGNPENSFQVIADHWNATIKQLAQNRIDNHENLDNLLSAENVAQFMVLFKHCRQICGSGKEDNYTDQAGYIGLANDLSKEKK